MRKVFKYPLQIEPSQEIEMPGTPSLFKFGLDPTGQLCVWALVTPGHAPNKQRFTVVGTGHPVPEDAYVWQATVNQGPFVWHIFTP